MGCPLHIDVDYQLVMRKMWGPSSGRSHAISVHRGPVWVSVSPVIKALACLKRRGGSSRLDLQDISASDHHNSIITGGSDGAVILGSVQHGFMKARKQPMSFHRLYEMDYDAVTGHYRMTDNFLPEVRVWRSGDRRTRTRDVCTHRAVADATAVDGLRDSQRAQDREAQPPRRH